MTTLLACDDFLMRLLDQGELIPIVAIVFGCTIGMVGIVAGTISGAARHRNIEKTRRELAAYVAEGSLDADKAVAILNAGRLKCDLDAILGRKA